MKHVRMQIFIFFPNLGSDALIKFVAHKYIILLDLSYTQGIYEHYSLEGCYTQVVCKFFDCQISNATEF